ncbi:hypothetical protein Bca101_043779 [Brassica carinata]
MEWENRHDRELDWSNRYGREMSWKWRMKNQSWKWNMRRIFIIQMSIRSYLVGPGTRWKEPKQELFEKRPLSAQKVERQASLDYHWPKKIRHVQDGLF